MRILLILLGFLPSSLRADRLIHMLNDPIPPYVDGEIGEPVRSGIAFEVQQEIFRRLGLAAQVDYRLTPWPRALEEVRIGKHDGLMVVHRTKEREAYFEYSEPLFVTPLVVFYSKKRQPQGIAWNEIKDLGKYEIAVTRGASFGPEWDQAVQAEVLKVNPVLMALHAMKMVQKNRVDFAPMNLLSGMYLIRQHGMRADVGISEKPIFLSSYHMVFSKKSPHRQLIPRINVIIEALRREGFIDRLIEANKKLD